MLLCRQHRRSISADMDGPMYSYPEIQAALASAAGTSSDYDLSPDARPPGTPKLRPASVLVPLVERAGGLQVVLTRRAQRLVHHPGQVSFPGGKQDQGDATALSAALREAWEEVGLHPDRVTVLGEFDRHETITMFRVTPFVGLVQGDFVAVADPSEVDEVFEVPLDFVLDPANLQVHHRRWQGRLRQYYAIPYGPHYIWGATARIIKSLSDRLVKA